MSPLVRRIVGAAATLLLVSGATAHDITTAGPGTGQLTRGASNPILRNNSSYDDLKVGPSTVVKVAPGDYRQWYEAIDAQNVPGARDFLTQTGYAVSTDGTSWTKKGIVFAPLPAPSWERSEVSPTSMHWDGSKWILYYHGGNNSGPRAIARATSPTGFGNFTRSPTKPILEKGESGSWDEEWVADAKVIPPWDGPDALWRMYYVGRTPAGYGQVGLATSTNGVAFTKYGAAPVVGFGASGEWDDGNIQAFTPEWDEELGVFRAWYVARRAAAGSGGGNAGYLWSEDGVNWNRSPENPVLRSIAGDNVEDSIDSYLDDGRYRLVYGQYDLGASPPLRGKGEAFLAPPPPGKPSTMTATFRVSTSGDDGDLERGTGAYPPSNGIATDGSDSGSMLWVRRSKATPSYHPVRVGLLRFDTSALPDDAIVTSAELRLHLWGKNETDVRSFVAEWYSSSAWPIDGGDWTLADSNSAHTGTPLSAITPGQESSFALRNLGSISLTGASALRLHVSGSATPPTGPNDLAFSSFDHENLPPPALVVTYQRVED